ncbi:ribonuclease [Luteitalea sp. TBR-22]|uniref:type II toxin-antitoxin system VapC family toxin n=1 Tax=Luteitalea sp. TBR-22 TaxID=2802971 RepID=UPI001AF9A725|nr:PIN domain-containing protein [Luteitalea sp. TBR-22]BCS35979.1 ribonuclease [Luteitalea sp. TBR-22]
MILVDTSVWIDHLRRGDEELSALLDEGQVLVHPFVVGEIACGSLKRRADVVAHLQRLPAAPVATEAEVHHLLEREGLHGRGLGWVDLHLLASARLAAVPLLTRDRALAGAARPR